MGQPACLEEDDLSLKKSLSHTKKLGLHSKIPTGLSSYKLDQDQDQDYEDPLKSKKTLAGLYKAPARPHNALAKPV